MANETFQPMFNSQKIIDETWGRLSKWNVRTDRPKFGFQKFNLFGQDTILKIDFSDTIPESIILSIFNLYGKFNDMNQLIEYYKQGDEIILSPLNQGDSSIGTFVPATIEQKFPKMQGEIDKLIQFLGSDFVNLNLS